MLHAGRARACRWLLAAVAMLGWASAGAQTLTGEAAAVMASGEVFFAQFTCTGSPTCTGTYTGFQTLTECSNEIQVAGSISFTGVNLSVVGGFQGSATIGNIGFSVTQDANHNCTVSGPGSPRTLTYQGGWDGTEGGMLLSGVDDDGQPVQVGVEFTATGVPPPPPKPQPFGLTTTVNVTPTTANATAVITPPATDVGKNESVFVFALAPRSIVKRAGTARPLDGTDSCVLAQLDPTGHLVQTSASQLQPYLTGVLSAQGQSVTVLDNASTPAIAGASFFVGYGSDGAAMVSTGVNRNVTTIPGATQCPGVVPASAGPLSGLWFNASEQGWGIDFVQRETHVFAAWFTYDASGNPKWYTASDCEMQASNASSGRCTGALYEVSGPPFLGVPFDVSRVHVSPVGTLQVDFANANSATMTYTVNGVSRVVPIVRQVFVSSGTPPAVDFTDLWWASPAQSESGWGMAISHQFNVMFLAWFVYDASGKPVWYVASDCVVTSTPTGCTGALYSVTGPPFGPTFDATQVHATPVGTITVIFSGPNDGSITYTVGSTTASKAITRQIF